MANLISRSISDSFARAGASIHAGAGHVKHAFSFQEGSLSGRAIRLLPDFHFIALFFQKVMVQLGNVFQSKSDSIVTSSSVPLTPVVRPPLVPLTPEERAQRLIAEEAEWDEPVRTPITWTRQEANPQDQAVNNPQDQAVNRIQPEVQGMIQMPASHATAQARAIQLDEEDEIAEAKAIEIAEAKAIEIAKAKAIICAKLRKKIREIVRINRIVCGLKELELEAAQRANEEQYRVAIQQRKLDTADPKLEEPRLVEGGVIAGAVAAYQATSSVVSKILDIPNTETAELIKKGLGSILPSLYQLQPEHMERLLSVYAASVRPGSIVVAGIGSTLAGMFLGREYMVGAYAFMCKCLRVSPDRIRQEMLVEFYPSRGQESVLPQSLRYTLKLGDNLHEMTHGMVKKMKKAAKDVAKKVTHALSTAQTNFATVIAARGLKKEDALQLSGELLAAIGASARDSLGKVAEGGSPAAQALLSVFRENGNVAECSELILKRLLANCLQDANAALNTCYVKCFVVQPATAIAAETAVKVTLGALLDYLKPEEVLSQLEANNSGLFKIIKGPIASFLEASAPSLKGIALEVNKAVIMAHVLTYVEHMNRVKNALYDEQGNFSFNQILTSSPSHNALLAESFTAFCAMITGAEMDSEKTVNLENQFRNGFAVYELCKLSSGGVIGALDGAQALTEAAGRDGVSPEIIASANGWIDSARTLWALPPNPAVAHCVEALNTALRAARNVSVTDRDDPTLNAAAKDVVNGVVKIANINKKVAVGMSAAVSGPEMVGGVVAVKSGLMQFAMGGNPEALMSALFKTGAALGQSAMSAGLMMAANKAGEVALESAIDAGIDAANPGQKIHAISTCACAFMDAFTDELRAPHGGKKLEQKDP